VPCGGGFVSVGVVRGVTRGVEERKNEGGSERLKDWDWDA
jgi:hypothetical protein